MGQFDSVTKHTLDANTEGQRLDNYLLKICKGIPKSRIYKAIRRGEVRLNGARCQASSRLHAGDELRLPPMRDYSDKQKPSVEEADSRVNVLMESVLFEDEHYLVINKLAGMASQRGSGVTVSVIDLIQAAGVEYANAALIHRLDKATSGCLLIAKSRQACAAIQERWATSDVRKTYWAVVRGVWPSEWVKRTRLIDLPLLRQIRHGAHRVIVHDDGKPAQTQVRLLQNLEASAIIEATLVTGRHHQIRAHMANIDHPLWGDDKYGDFSLNRQLVKQGIDRLCLHASSIEFRHPYTGEMVVVKANVGKDFYRLVLAVDGELRVG